MFYMPRIIIMCMCVKNFVMLGSCVCNLFFNCVDGTSRFGLLDGWIVGLFHGFMVILIYSFII